MGEVAVAGDEDGVDQAGQERRVEARESDVQEDVGGGGQDDQAHGKADAIDGEAAQPLPEVVAVGAEDEVFVAEERDGDGDGGGDGEGNVGDERLAAVRQQVSEEDDTGRVEGQRDDGVGDTDREETDHLARGQGAAKSSEWAVRFRFGRCAVGDEDVLVGWVHGFFDSIWWVEEAGQSSFGWMRNKQGA